MRRLTPLSLTFLGLIAAACGRESRETVPEKVSSRAAEYAAPASTVCDSTTPQAAADRWLRERLRAGAKPRVLDTLYVSELESPAESDSSARLGAEYGAFFRAFYGEEALAIEPVWFWRQDAQHEAYVLRVPSEMYGTATALWTYDALTCSWGRGPMTSDRGGDGGELYRLDSWIVDLDDDGESDLVQRVKNWGDGEDGKPYVSDKFRMFFWHAKGNYFAETLGPDETRPRAAFDFKVP